MSILDWPRVNFRGVFSCNPCTSNNDDVFPDVVVRDTNTLGPDLAGMTDDEARAFLRGGVHKSEYDSSDTACKPFVRGGWNVFGDHATLFRDTVVTSVVTGPQGAAATPEQDSLVGRAVNLLGALRPGSSSKRTSAVMVDLDPTGLVTTQVYLGGLQIQGDGEDLVLDHQTRCFQNWLNFQSTVVEQGYQGTQNFVGIGCIMQFAIPADALPEHLDSSSPGLAALIAAGRAAAGLVVRFRCYEVEPAIRDEDMVALFAKNQTERNPGLGFLVGTIGVWRKGEPQTEPPGRKLTAPYPRPDMQWARPDGMGAPVTVPGIPNAWSGPPALVGNVVAHLQPDASVISLDLVGAFPKYGFRNPLGPPSPAQRQPGFDKPRQKADVGTLELVALREGQSPVSLCDVPYGLYDFASYEDRGGIVDIPVDPAVMALAREGRLAIRGKADSWLNAGVTLAEERRFRLMTDDRGVYMMPGELGRTVRLKVSERGGPTTEPVTVFLREYVNIIETNPGGGCEDGRRPNQTTTLREVESLSKGEQARNRLAFPTLVTIPAGVGFDEWVDVQISAARGGAAVLNYQLGNYTMGKSVPAWSDQVYSSVRVYADEDFSALYDAGPLQWEDVYEHTLRYYHVLFPAMSAVIPLNKPDSILKMGARLKERLHTPDRPEFYSTLNMPITRTLTPARIQLLLDWVEQQSAKT